MKQNTLLHSHGFSGKGLHTGGKVNMRVSPAPEDTGVVFVRKDLGAEAVLKARADLLSGTSRSTSLSNGEFEIHTVEHILSALYGMGVDNAVIELDNSEVPILDGSASCYVKAFAGDLKAQEKERKYYDLRETVEVRDEGSGSFVRLTPSAVFSADLVVDFNSSVLGVQKAHWDEGVDYASQIGVCRTFVFFHELEQLYANNLIKGGDADNAIVIVERPVSDEQLDRLSSLFGKPKLSVSSKGYLNNLKLHFPDECGRHKMLDLLGDLSLAGMRLKAKVEAFKPGHKINTAAAKAVLKLIDK